MKSNFPQLIKVATVAFAYFLCVGNVSAQTNPVAASLPYAQTFTALAASSTILPSEWAAWNLSTVGPTTSFPTVAPPVGSDLALTASANATTSSLGLMNYNGKIGMLSGTGVNSSLVLAISTLNVSNVSVAFDVMTIRNPFDASNTRIEQVDLQFRVGTVGVFSSVSGVAAGIYQNNTINQTGAVTTPQNSLVKTFTLPAACNNKPIVQLRWVTRDVSGVNNRPSFAIDNVSICPTILTPTISITGPSGYCSGNNSFYNATITNGGTVPVYQWKKNGTNVGTNSSFLSLTGLTPGDQITCQLTSNAACVSSNVVTSSPITISTSNTPPTINLVALSDVSCPNAKNGSIDISVSGGTPPYTFAWDTVNRLNGSSFAVTIGPKTITDPLFGQGNPNVFYIDGVEAKELYLTKGISYSFNVLTPAHPFQISTDLIGGNANFLVNNGQTGAPSQNGVVTFTPNNSHPSLLYYPCQFHTFMGYKVNIINGQQTEDVNNLNPGIYNVLVTDANGCTAISQYQVNELPSPVSVSGTITNSICGTYTGSVELDISGGVPPYTVIWDTLNTSVGPNFNVMVGPKTATNPYYGLGNLECFYIDAVEAPQQNLVRGITYSYNVFNPGHPFHFSTDSVGANTSGFVSLGQANAPNDNGLVSFTPAFSSPSNLNYACANHAFMGGKANLFTGYASTDLLNVKPGTYTAVVKDALGCIAQESFVVVEDGSGLSISTDAVIATSCIDAADGSIDISIVGGASPYNITWDTVNLNNAGVFNVMVGTKTPTNPFYGIGRPECFYLDGEEQNSITLTRGISYLFNVLAFGHSWHISTDEFGGTLFKIVSNGQSGAPTDNGTVIFKPSFKHSDLLYYQCGVHDYMGAPINIIDGPSSTHLENLPAGQYTVVVTDAIGCSSVSVITVPSGTSSCDLILNLKVLLQAMYSGGSTMAPRLYNTGMSTDPTAVDNITVELRDPNDYSVVASVTDILHTDGMMNVSLPANVLGNSYYIVVHHENSIETWSKDPVPFMVSPVSFDFSGQN
ncbi:MAG TPA: SprB repeat-containing protein [Bacteroidia bacterium]|jgi:hypothetical protein|nr:SprB repeat-containing protein [Bacteroidia bacterium]HQF27501.1 SprB repeat-containing protein [Bacteroidia bacterium]HQK96488.1 SprB repeat-containing protein [Bacteroidia bacterium]